MKLGDEISVLLPFYLLFSTAHQLRVNQPLKCRVT